MAKDVRVAILGDSRDFSKAVRNAQQDTRKLNDSFDGVSRGVGRMSKAIAIGVAGLAVGGAVLAKGFVDAAVESQKVSKQTEAVLKSMGDAAGVTAKQVSDLSTELSMQTGIDDELIQSGSNLLLTFGKIQNKVGKGNAIFDRATEAALDMSVALGTDMKSASMLVGKALNDPIRGLTALRRSGIQFTKQQEDQIKAMVESGDLLGAQKVLLSELDKQFGGSAEAQATAGDKLKVAWGNIQEQLGGVLLPIFEKVAAWLSEKLPQAIAIVEPVLQRLAAWFEEEVAPAIKTAADAIGAFISDTLEALSGWWDENGETIKTLIGDIGDAAGTMWDGLMEAWPVVKEIFDTVTDWFTESPGRMQYLAGVVAIGFGIWAAAAAIAAAVGVWAAVAPVLPFVALILLVAAAAAMTEYLIDKFDLMPKASSAVQWLIDHGLVNLVNILIDIDDRLFGIIEKFRQIGSLLPDLPFGPSEGGQDLLNELFPEEMAQKDKEARNRRQGSPRNLNTASFVSPVLASSSPGNSYNITVNALDPKAAGRVVVEALQSFESSNGKGWRG